LSRLLHIVHHEPYLLYFVLVANNDHRDDFCASSVKLKLFQSCCLCFYDIVSWFLCSIGSLSKFRSGYIKSIKLFLGYKKYYSVTNIVFETGLPSFDRLVSDFPPALAPSALGSGLCTLTAPLSKITGSAPV